RDKNTEIADAIKKSWQKARDLSKQTTEVDETQTGQELAFIFESVAEDYLTEPTFIYNFPKPISPLSKASPDNPAIAERFELYVAGMEVANRFSELNDPAE